MVFPCEVGFPKPSRVIFETPPKNCFAAGGNFHVGDSARAMSKERARGFPSDFGYSEAGWAKVETR